MFLLFPSLWPLLGQVKLFPALVGAQGEKLPGSITMPSRGKRDFPSGGKFHMIVPMPAFTATRSSGTTILPPSTFTSMFLTPAAPHDFLSTPPHNARQTPTTQQPTSF